MGPLLIQGTGVSQSPTAAHEARLRYMYLRREGHTGGWRIWMDEPARKASAGQTADNHGAQGKRWWEGEQAFDFGAQKDRGV